MKAGLTLALTFAMARAPKKSIFPTIPKTQTKASKTQSLTKLPIQPAQTGVASSTLTGELEKLKKEISFLREKNKTLADKLEHMAPQLLKDELHAALIPKPPGECGRGLNAKKQGYHLRRAMGLSCKKALYNKIQVSFTQLTRLRFF